MWSITSLPSKFQIISNPFGKYNSARYYAASKKVSSKKSKSLEKPTTGVGAEAGVNEVTLLGTLGKDPWLATVDGKQKLFLLVSVPNSSLFWKGVKKVNWYIVYAEGESMIKSLQSHVREGMRVYLQGRLSCTNKSDTKTSSMVITKFFSL